MKGLTDVVPAAQPEQASPPDEVLPAAQLLQLVKGLDELLPAAQLVQEVPSMYWPALQLTVVQLLSPLDEVWPDGQL